MRILFQNYSNSLSSEPLYMHNALRQCGIESHLWSDPNVSAFDALDTVKPDVLVCHYRNITNDVVTYLKTNKLDLVINATGATESQLKSIAEVFKETGTNVPFIFSNSAVDIMPKVGLRTEQILPAADIFNIQPKSGRPHEIEAVVSNDFSENVKNMIGEMGVYHLLYVTDGELNPTFDLRVTAMSLTRLFNVYKKISLVGDKDLCLSQMFFDMVLAGVNMQIKCSDQPSFNKFLNTVFKESDTDNIPSEIKNQIKTKHTPFHRAGRLLKFLKHTDGVNNVEKAKNQLPELLKDI